MKAFICIASNNGISLNGKNVSKDAIVVEKILQIVKNHPLVFLRDIPCRKKTKNISLIQELAALKEKHAGEITYCYINGVDIKPIIGQIDTIYLIHWNEEYPADVFFHKEWLDNYHLESTDNFKGESHERITIEKWARQI